MGPKSGCDRGARRPATAREWLAGVGRDARHGLRLLGRSPGFTAVALATIALGVAANVTVASFVDALFLKPLALPGAERLVIAAAASGGETSLFGRDEAEFLRAHLTTVEHVAAHYSSAPLYLSAPSAAEDGQGEVQGAVVSSGYFAALGLRAWRGRLFAAQEDAVPDRDAVAVVSHDFWRRHMAADAAALGRTIVLNGRAFTVVGILPPGFRGVVPGEAPDDVWIPSMMVRTGYRWCDALRADCHIFGLLARLPPDRGRSAAAAELSALAARFETATATANTMPRRLTFLPLRGADPARPRPMVDLARLLGAAAAILLLVACANLGALQVARGSARQHEIALRISLGARRARIARQLLTENLLLALAGGAGGLLLSRWTSRLLFGFYTVDSEGYRHLFDLGLDGRVLAAALVVSLAAGLLFGAWPAVLCLRQGTPARTVAAGTGGMAARTGRISARTGRMPASAARAVLTGVQVALSLVLVVGAVLLARSARQIEAGRNLDPRHVAVLRLRPRLAGYPPERARLFQHEVQRRLAALPGVESLSLARGQGLVWQAAGDIVAWLPDRRPPKLDMAPRTRFHEVGPRYFATLRIPLRAGREFDDRDTLSAPPVAIVNQTLAQALWPGRSPLDATLVVANGADIGGERTVRVVGIAADSRLRNGLEPPAPMVYLPYWQGPDQVDSRLCIRVAGDPAAALPAIRSAIAAVDPRVPISEAMPLTVQVRGVYTQALLAGRVLLCAAGMALLLSAIGLYGALAFVVSLRTREIAVRLAVGATRAQVAAIFLRQGLATAAAGTTLGLVAALAAARLLAAWLYGVAPTDPLAFLAAPALLILVAAAASYLPARRAAAVEPMRALRSE